MVLTRVDEAEVASVIQTLRLQKTCDAKVMSVWFLKQYFRHILTPSTELIIFSLEAGVFPDILKIGKGVPYLRSETQVDWKLPAHINLNSLEYCFRKDLPR